MERRDFFKIISATSATVLATSCGKKEEALIPLLVPEHEMVPGVEQWHPAVCAECGAGCGTLVRVMEAERVIERNGEKLRERIAAVKKIEGNPLDPVSGGRLCARGQAAVQGLYHPDRLRGPMKRTGDRGKAQFAGATWEDALATVADRLAKADASRVVVITGSQTGTRSLAWQRFTAALHAPAPLACSIADFASERKAAELVFGWKGSPVYDLANAHYALGVGADFLGAWQSPVYYARQFGHFRQGRGEVRGRLVQAESRLSVTASAADKWLPLRPGSEPQFLAAIACVLLEEKLARHADALPKPVAAEFGAADVAALSAACGVEQRRLRTVARELGQWPAPLVIAGAGTLHSNSVAAVAASHYINLMLGNVGQPGGVLAPAASENFDSRDLKAALEQAQIVLIDGANPLYTLPSSMGAQQALSRAETVISFAPFLDDTGAFADWLLPDHHTLELEAAVAPAATSRVSIAISAPFVRPLYETRAVEQTLAGIAAKMNVAYQPATAKDVVTPQLPADASYDDVARQGGLWLDPPAPPKIQAHGWEGPITPAAEFQGGPAQFPFQFLPYFSVQYYDGRASHLPWLQELPDPASSAMWGLPVEVDPYSAARLGIRTGDRVKVESAHGSLEAPAFVHPGAAPGVISMAIGDGHTHFGRYASGRGSNPLSILAPVAAWGSTRVRLTRLGDRHGFIQFSAQYREEGPGHR